MLPNKLLVNTNRAADIRVKWTKFVPIFALLALLCFFLPFSSVNGETLITATFFGKMFGALSGGRLALLIVVFTLQMTVFVFCLAALFIFKDRASLLIAAVVQACTCAFWVVFMFNAKWIFDASGFYGSAFMIKNFGAAYWLLLICNLALLFVTLKSIRVSTCYILLTVLAVVWIAPIFFLFLTSIRAEQGYYIDHVFPHGVTFENYIDLFTDTSAGFDFGRMFLNTIIVSVCSCLISTLITLSTAYVLSRIEFKQKKFLMSFFLILGMFPGFMSMIAVYYIIKWLGLSQSLFALIMVYSGGAALGYYIVKGFFDTVPKAIEEAAYIDGATKGATFFRIILPLSKPIIVYVIVTSFLSPWGDYIISRTILGDATESYTVAVGLYNMLQPRNIESWYTRFAAGAMTVAVPATLLFIAIQKYYIQGLTGAVKG